MFHPVLSVVTVAIFYRCRRVPPFFFANLATLQPRGTRGLAAAAAAALQYRATLLGPRAGGTHVPYSYEYSQRAQHSRH